MCSGRLREGESRRGPRARGAVRRGSQAGEPRRPARRRARSAPAMSCRPAPRPSSRAPQSAPLSPRLTPSSDQPAAPTAPRALRKTLVQSTAPTEGETDAPQSPRPRQTQTQGITSGEASVVAPSAAPAPAARNPPTPGKPAESRGVETGAFRARLTEPWFPRRWGRARGSRRTRPAPPTPPWPAGRGGGGSWCAGARSEPGWARTASGSTIPRRAQRAGASCWPRSASA